MTDSKQLLADLRRLKVETGSLVCLGCGHERKCSICGCAIIKDAVELIERMADELAGAKHERDAVMRNVVVMEDAFIRNIWPCKVCMRATANGGLCKGSPDDGASCIDPGGFRFGGTDRRVDTLCSS